MCFGLREPSGEAVSRIIRLEPDPACARIRDPLVCRNPCGSDIPQLTHVAGGEAARRQLDADHPALDLHLVWIQEKDGFACGGPRQPAYEEAESKDVDCDRHQ